MCTWAHLSRIRIGDGEEWPEVSAQVVLFPGGFFIANVRSNALLFACKKVG